MSASTLFAVVRKAALGYLSVFLKRLFQDCLQLVVFPGLAEEL
jgi:hypothetical protein